MAEPTLRTYVLETPRPLTCERFWHWESINLPPGRYFMKCFHPEGADVEPFTAAQAHEREFGSVSEDRFSRWVRLRRI